MHAAAMRGYVRSSCLMRPECSTSVASRIRLWHRTRPHSKGSAPPVAERESNMTRSFVSPMERVRGRVRPVADAGRSSRRHRGTPIVMSVLPGLALAVGLLATTAARGAALTPHALTFGAGASSIGSTQQSAAAVIAHALAPGGSGITFRIVQTSTVNQKPGGPQVPILDAHDPTRVASYAQSVFSISLLESGFATPDGFYAELRDGPMPGESPDWQSQPHFRALARDGKVYRDDGKGWYVTTNPPGIALDPNSIHRLAGLVGNASGAADAGVDPADASLREMTASAAAADAPGLVAADGASFTQFRGQATFELDPAGRVVRIHQTALNTNMTDFDLVVQTDITLSYGSSDPLPAASPALTSTKPVTLP